MTDYVNIAPDQLKIVEQTLHQAAFFTTELYSYFQAHDGLILDLGQGIDEHEIYKWNKMKPGQISYGFSDLPQSLVKLTKGSQQLATLATKVVVTKKDWDAWRNPRTIFNAGGDMLAQAIDQQVMTFLEQVDSFIAHGDDMKHYLSADPYAGAGDFTGMFNGFTAITAGLGGDNIMDAAGDYMHTIAKAIEALENAGFKADGYYVFSDTGTKFGAQKGNNIYLSNTPTTEWDTILLRRDVISWRTSTNLQNRDSENKLLVTTPYVNQKIPNKKPTPAYRLLQGYDFTVIPLNGGQLNSNAEFETIVAWSGAVEEIHPTAVQNTAALTL